MWRSLTSSKKDDSVHIRVMGALAVGKTTLVSTAVTRTFHKRFVPYSRSRYNQRFLCSAKGPDEETIVAELIDAKGDETLESLIVDTTHDEEADETKPLLNASSTRWCYFVVFDFTRYETYVHARKLVDSIRAYDALQAEIKPQLNNLSTWPTFGWSSPRLKASFSYQIRV
jgi:hypothetical protein